MTATDWLELGSRHFECGKYEDALASFTRLPQEWPEYDINVAKALAYLNEPEASIGYATKAIERFRYNPEAYSILAFAEERMGRVEAALEDYGMAKDLCPSPQHWRNYAHVHEVAGRVDDAIALYKEMLALYPTDMTARLYLGLAQMSQGNWDEGLENFEARQFLYNSVPPNGKQIWQGENLNGATIALWQEQGIGDAIQFARYAHLLKDVFHAERVVLYCDDSLYRLFSSGLVGVDDVLTKGKSELVQYSVHFPLMSFPRVLRQKGMWDGPDYEGYLGLPLDTWADWKDPNRRARIGICWKGNPKHANDRWRSAKLEDFAPLLGLDADLICLQYGARDEALKFGMDRKSPILTDMYDVADMIGRLDVVVTVDTAVAHLAGAVGAETYLLLPPNPDWRWGRIGEKTPWYPTVKLIRTEKYGDYGKAIKQLVGRIG